MCRVRNLCALSLLLFLSPSLSVLRAQTGEFGSIEGVVTDPSGAVVVGAAVKAYDQQTSARRETSTNEDGLFHFLELPSGSYELTVEQSGFATMVIQNLVVTVGARMSLPLTLHVAGQTQSVVVRSASPLLETTSSQMSTTVENRSVTALPINGRAVIELALLTPGVTRDVRGGLSFAGQRESNSLVVDGVDNNGHFYGEPLGADGFSPGGRGPYQFSQEAVLEFRVDSNAYSAEFGRALGGNLSLVTKSGTNQFHGSAFDFYRDKSMNANDTVNNLNGLPKSPFHFHQFGGTIGGPIVHDHLFFFSGYEGERSTVPNSVVLNLPNGFQLSSNLVTAGYQQFALDYLLPRAKSWVRDLQQNNYLAKLDWQISPAQQLSGRWSRQRFAGPSPGTGGPQNSFENGGMGELNTDAVSLSLSSQVSPQTVNAAHFSYVRSDTIFQHELTYPQASIFEGGQLALTVGGGAGNPQSVTEHYTQWSDTISSLHGVHSFKIGADFLLDHILYFSGANFSGSYRFQSLESFGRSLAGTPQPAPQEQYIQAFSGLGTPGAMANPNLAILAGFTQDEWRVRPRLTINLGLRYDLQLIARPPIMNPSPALTAASLDTSLIPTDKNNVAPRVGFAWTPLHNGKLVLRGGYGIYYVPTLALGVAQADLQNGISVQTRTFTGGTRNAGLIPSYPNTVCGPSDPSGDLPSCAPPSAGAGSPLLTLFSSTYTQGYSQQGSMGVEVQLKSHWVLGVCYLAVKGTHLQRIRDANLAAPTTPTFIGIANTSSTLTYQNFTLPKPIVGFDRILEFFGDANSIYHGLAVRMDKRFADNYQFSMSYTFGKVIDDAPTPYAVGTGADASMLSNPLLPQIDRAAGTNDQRHRLVATGIWQLEYANHLPQLPRKVLRGWQLSGIATLQSGQPYSGLVNNDLNNDGNSSSDRTPGLGRNTYYMPASFSLDLRVTRTFQFNERARIQFIWEAFNVFNHSNITKVRTTQYAQSFSPTACGIAGAPCLMPQNAGLSAFGTPTASSGPRIMQLAARFIF